jgi:hypothetical protein
MPSARIVVAMLCYAMHTMLCTRRPGKAAQDIGISPAEVQLQAILHASPRDCKWADVFRLRRPASHSIIATPPQQSTRLRASHARRLHQRRSAVRCILVVHMHGAGAADQPVGPAAETLLSNGDAVCLCVYVCISRLYFCYTHTTRGCHHQPQAPPTAAHGVCQASLETRQDTSRRLSVHPESHDWSPGRLGSSENVSATPPTNRVGDRRCHRSKAVCSVWWACVRHGLLENVFAHPRKHMRTLFWLMAAMPGRHCAPTEGVPILPGHQHARWRSRLHNRAPVASYAS